ncbi:hypothetical protein [Haladaptatus caseinilyticus]|uniref:hypothetical protein n=1 Tax=Haladaptatus caseinilyticus TaxID=2993314 RepID=UPI00224B6166|nr:hypothetical protein [Haladaptatus caseinilyticus]
MPLTPYHLGIGLFLGLALFRWLDFPMLCIATMIVDIRSIAIYFGPFTGNLHGPLHTVFGGTLLAGVLATGMYRTKPLWNRLGAPFGLAQKRSLSRIVAASLIGVYSHLILDAIMHTDMQPLYPLSGNPLLGIMHLSDVYIICVAGFLFGGIFYLVHLYRWRRGNLQMTY